ncbi:MAG: hypothetical protein P1P88_15410, partial [Bacteroidales bacterium]|nr:hypothetical protein [Bacteroidales bacterium]
EELKMYQEIRALEENKSLDYHVVQKCDEIVKGYLDEIELRKAKIELYKSLIVKYLANKEKMLLIKSRKDNESIAQTKLASLEKHSKRLEQLRTDPENFAAHIEETNHLDMLKDEVNEVYEEFEISEEVRDYLLNLDEQFRTSGTGFNSRMAITEIEQLMKKINQEK